VFTRILPSLVERFSQFLLEEEKKSEITNNRNGAFQNKLINKIDAILYDVLEIMNDKRYFSKEMIEERLKDQQGICPFCSEKITEKQKYEGDHINPWTNGGKTEKENLQVVHQRCHKLKSS
jgi:5-methylcytosine-specific restriction endonuclease McrA